MIYQRTNIIQIVINMIFNFTELILLISFGLIYFVFLLYDLFRRGDNYGSFVYVIAVIPANYLWYVIAENGEWEFGLTGAMMVLAGMWLLAVVRDIYLKDRAQGYKDSDDVALMLVIGVVINLILSAVLPAFDSLSSMRDGSNIVLKFFYTPILDPTALFAPSQTIILIYKILVTVLVLSMIYPTVIDLRDTPVNLVALIILTIVFAIPFIFLAYIWAPNPSLIWVLLVLFSVLFFTFLLMITRGMDKY